jgi:hypothetical protein
VLAKVPPWTEAETLAKEKEILGFYVSSHPLERWRGWSSVFATASIESLKEAPQDRRVVLPCIVQSVRQIVVKSGRSAGQKMAIAVMEDKGGTVETVLFTDCYAQFQHLIQPDQMVFVLGRVDRSRVGTAPRGGAGNASGGDDESGAGAAGSAGGGGVQIVAERIVPIDGTPLLPGRLCIRVDGVRLNGSSSGILEQLAGVLLARQLDSKTEQAAAFPVDLVVDTEDGRVILEAGPMVRAALQPPLVSQISTLLGDDCVRVVRGIAVETSDQNRRGNWSKSPKRVG